MKRMAERKKPAEKPSSPPARDDPHHEEALIDEAVAETLPASDPIAPAAGDGPVHHPNPDRGGRHWRGWPKGRSG